MLLRYLLWPDRYWFDHDQQLDQDIVSNVNNQILCNQSESLYLSRVDLLANQNTSLFYQDHEGVPPLNINCRFIGANIPSLKKMITFLCIKYLFKHKFCFELSSGEDCHGQKHFVVIVKLKIWWAILWLYLQMHIFRPMLYSSFGSVDNIAGLSMTQSRLVADTDNISPLELVNHLEQQPEDGITNGSLTQVDENLKGYYSLICWNNAFVTFSYSTLRTLWWNYSYQQNVCVFDKRMVSLNFFFIAFSSFRFSTLLLICQLISE